MYKQDCSETWAESPMGGFGEDVIFGIKNLFHITDVNYAMQDDIHSGDFSTISWGRTVFLQLSWKPF